MTLLMQLGQSLLAEPGWRSAFCRSWSASLVQARVDLRADSVSMKASIQRRYISTTRCRRSPPLSIKYGCTSDKGSLMRTLLRSVSTICASSTPADCLTHVMTPCSAGTSTSQPMPIPMCAPSHGVYLCALALCRFEDKTDAIRDFIKPELQQEHPAKMLRADQGRGQGRCVGMPAKEPVRGISLHPGALAVVNCQG